MGPYSMDLRERVAAAIDEGEGSQRQVAKRFRVSVSFVTRLLQRRRDAGTLAPKPHGGGPRPVLGFPEQVRLAMLIAEHPDATLNQLKERGGFACTLTTIWRTLRRFRLTSKKKTLHARERDDPKVPAKRRRYRRKVEQMDAKRLVFVDETGINTAMTPSHAWARRGERAIGSVPTSWGSTTVIAALGLDGVRAPLVFPGATDTQAFQTYVEEVLVPELRPGDVVIFDNLKPHRSPHAAESIGRAGASVLPLPPYSSDYDPIEELWSKFKGELRRVAARVRNDLYNAVGETLDPYVPHIRRWISPNFSESQFWGGTGVWKRRRQLRADSTGKAHGNGNPAHKRSISSTAAPRARDEARVGLRGSPGPPGRRASTDWATAQLDAFIRKVGMQHATLHPQFMSWTGTGHPHANALGATRQSHLILLR